MTKSSHMPLLWLLFATLNMAACSGRDEAPEAPSAPATALTVRVVKPQQQQWEESLQANGPIQAWQEIIVSPETSGLRIAELRAEPGDKVKRGDVLARLADDSVRAELRKQQAAVAQARTSLAQARANHQRAEAAAGSGALSEQQIEEYRLNDETAQATLASALAELDSIQLKLSQTRIVAVDDAVVASKSGVLGNVVATGSELYRLIRQGRLEWRPELDARQLAAVRHGQSVRLTLPDGQSAEGTVRLAGPVIDGNTGRAVVYVSLAAGSSARSGMFAKGSIAVGASSALTLPQAAVVLRDGRAYVWLVDKDGKTATHLVTTGRRQGGRVEVLSGVQSDDRVVAAGGSFLSEGASVTVADAFHTPDAPPAQGATR